MTKKIAPNLLKKYHRIIDEWFVNGFHGANAYKKHFPTTTKDTTATVNFNRLRHLPEVQEYIDIKHEKAAKIVQTTHEGLLKELQNWLQFDITETIALTADEIKALPIEIKRLIIKYKARLKHFYDKDGNLLNTEETIELHFVSKEKAIDMINKHVGFYEADNNQRTTTINITATNDKHKALIDNILEGEV